MKFKSLGLVICAAFLALANMAAGAEKGEASSEGKCLKIGVVSVRKIFQDCKRNVKYRQDLSAERDKMAAELEKLRTLLRNFPQIFA